MKYIDEKKDIDQLCVTTLRLLAVDMVEKAKSGHPGLPLGAAPMAYALFNRVMRYNPRGPRWFNRDRFVLSAGHGSALQYAMLYLTGFDLPMDELKRFRQYESLTPGHPEYGLTAGIEATTGPLGQGFAMGVGMAMAERYLAAYFNRPDFPLIDHYTYAIVSDGDLMEGVSSEAASLAGHLKLSKLIYLYDDNHISIDGNTEKTFSEDVGRRFEAYNWQVLRVADSNDIEAIAAAVEEGKRETTRPTLVIVRTHIGYGSPKQDTPAVHGEPLGAEAMKATRAFYSWPEEPFFVPDEALAYFRKATVRGEQLEFEWIDLFTAYREKFPELAAQFDRVLLGELPPGWDSEIPVFKPEGGAVATRDASGKVMNGIAKNLPMFLGGSADLAASTKTDIKDGGDYSAANPLGKNIRFGVREHTMGGIANGLAVHGGIIPYTGTFLVFSDYMRPALRLAALMKAHVIFTFSHDSIGLGEDGPTHQPIEHLMGLRIIPNMVTLRPADANETAAAWKFALQHRGPVTIVTTRQKLPILDTGKYPVLSEFSRGAYTLSEAGGGKPDIILVASGSEVQLIMSAGEKLAADGIKARIVSMPSWELFDEQPAEYREKILTPGISTLAVEAAWPDGWYKYVGEKGDVIGLRRFGASAPGDEVMHKLGFSIENVIEKAKALIGR